MSEAAGAEIEGLSLSPAERERIAELIGRAPTRVELFLFDVQWSEHCSYKSSRAALKRLPSEAPTVIMGPGEDAGILRLPDWDGRGWGLAVAHESHNHPSQVVPEEGAATGIGGIVRDVNCMGAEVIAVLDGLRFGDPLGERGRRVAEIARGVVSGIWHYGNALGVPNLGGDTLFHSSFDENCLVNVVAAGIVATDEIVPSAVPAAAREEPHVFILVGKPTDWSGMGGATLASRVLDHEKDESDRGAVQAADPFLKRVLFEANRELFRMLRAEGIAFGMKDLGAGGVAGVSAEIASRGGFGMELSLDEVHRVDPDLPSEVIACAETQERYGIVVPERIADRVLALYNETYALPVVHRGARASVVGRPLSEPVYRCLRGEEAVAEISIAALVEGIRVERAARPRARSAAAPSAARSKRSSAEALETLAELLASPALASRHLVYRYYDTEVQGRAVIRPGEADAAVLRPIPDAPFAVAFSLDGNPRLGVLDPRAAAQHAVCEGVRNVVASGATPLGLTDCLNFGSPEDPEVFWDFTESVAGLADAATALGLRDHAAAPLPFVSGNVSFYNQSVSGRAIAPSPIVGTFGLLERIGLATTIALKSAGNALVLLGSRGSELGGSIFAERAGGAGAAIPPVDLAGERARARTVEEAIRAGHVLAAHDISEGGFLVAVVEMAMAARRRSTLGVRIDRGGFGGGIEEAALLWNEAGGYILEVEPARVDPLTACAAKWGATATRVGEVSGDGRIHLDGFAAASPSRHVDSLRRAWENGLAPLFGSYGGDS